MAGIIGKKILIAGFGVEGKSTLHYLEKNYPNLEITIADKNSGVLTELKNKFKINSGENYLDNIDKFDTIIRSPGIPLEHLKKARYVTSHTNIFFEKAPGKIIAVTGTKGKSTTATLIYELLRTSFRDVRLTGNIGLAGLDALKDSNKNTIFVFEISSFQLEDIRYSPHIAVILGITNDHIDRHGTLAGYVRAKQNIVKFQTKKDFVFYNSREKNASRAAKISKATQIPVSPQKILFKTSLIGEGNEINIAIATAVAKHLGVSEKNVKKIISNFKPLPHRIEKVGEYKGINFYDDSIATNPSASLNGIDALKSDLETVIIGGANKGFDFKDYVKEVSKRNIKNIILMPDTGLEMKLDFEKLAKNSKILTANSMNEAVKLAYRHTSQGKAALLSPAATSFNMFKDYKERGDVFRSYVKELGK